MYIYIYIYIHIHTYRYTVLPLINGATLNAVLMRIVTIFY